MFPTKTWKDIESYRQARLREALVEARLSLEFLEDGLVRNAAGKAFQAWKAYLGALAAEHRDKLKPIYPGSRKIRAGEEEVEDVDVVIALAPTSVMFKIAAELAKFAGVEVVKNTAIALQLHRYQYNGPDPEGLLTDIPDDKTAAHLICALLQPFSEHLGELYDNVCGTLKRQTATTPSTTPGQKSL
ncbi:PaREP1 family protein [Pyrobaculum calidifontis]|uniref:PaREP1 domain containing protein n=1 Tax=Pyrobaculum calidifontis (strain DSM 21063 / JCM 11548 / VA1) TaxID=410359 RepID=A3MXR2_PYRCJ|nr:PaREP1 family protein [Pyrobaculum calidifontis]ABO09429.1 PaREP1 domain containing protein [Pyrobaculum calidifontis JCM 11548]